MAPAGTGEIISAIQVRFLDKNGQIVEGHTRPSVFLRELDLRPGTSYDQTLAQQGLDRISRLSIVRAAGIALEPGSEPDQVTLVVLVRERPSFQPSLGVILPSPSALEGPFQQNPALGAGNGESTGPAIDGNIQVVNIGGNDQTLRLQVRGGERVFDTELSFTDPWIGNEPIGISANVFNQRSVQSVFTRGDRDVNLPNGNTPWVHRLGGGVELFRPLTPDLQVAAGVNYQRISIHNSAFETDTFNRDELGRRLTVSNTGEDDLLTLSFSGDLDRRNNRDNPTRGSRFRFGIDQAIPVGDAKIKFTRFRVNYTQFIPLNLFGFAPGPRTLVLNGQAGTTLGDVPPYEAFDLTGIPVGDYAGNSFGTGASFALLLAEYRFPIANFSVFRRDVQLGGNLFGAYATTLGTDNLVIGQPSVTREKPGEGFIYGFGLRALTNFGLIRLEFGLNDQGDGLVLFTVGDRF
jgi:outer membrane protein insertion porin family